MQKNQGNSKPEQQPERVKLPAPGITSLASTEDIVEMEQPIPSFTENRHDDMIFPSLHMANRELRRAKYKVQRWERICAALRELNKHRDIVTQLRKEDVRGRTIKSTG